MIFSLFQRKKSNRQVIERQYELITNAARRPVFYASMDVPDTVMGRFEMISVHLILYLRASNKAGETAARIAQEIVDAFFEDVDHSIRELGIGDTSVPKRMKKFSHMFYGRAKSYEEAIAAGDADALAAALGRNIHPEAGDARPAMTALARYMVETNGILAEVSAAEFEAGRVTFPDAGPDTGPDTHNAENSRKA
ncbi:ubiquinol-cytochrome C chaperone [Pseudohoeflea suaedae]|uniref:Ubiquinol-cytochrome C chaperone n=1 Tax=Pseudohoeflea suaedae TaxID=877384 RepID=A0A4R5PPW9_9HYPH|nr:ubiquinol-cytochrome C chaperone family protein [Pseudohoeflea suaedae]TDH38978.1 ubiquinol-cytochrome C chaperone [Pseudohoeflea suaedae]